METLIRSEEDGRKGRRRWLTPAPDALIWGNSQVYTQEYFEISWVNPLEVIELAKLY